MFLGQVKIAESAAGVEVTVAWQAPVGGYDEKFPLVTLQPKMSATLALTGTNQVFLLSAPL